MGYCAGRALTGALLSDTLIHVAQGNSVGREPVVQGPGTTEGELLATSRSEPRFAERCSLELSGINVGT